MTDYTTDAQGNLSFVISQATHIEREVNEVRYAEVQFPELVTVDSSANDFAKTVTYYSGNDFGQAEWINGNSGDMPLAGREMEKFETQVHTAGLGYGYGLEEISQARMLGHNLATDGARAARRGFMYHVEDVVINGSVEKGFEGLINSTKVAIAVPATGTWLNATPAQILADINLLITQQASDTNFVIFADTLLLPYDRWTHLASTQNGDGNDTTTLKFLEMNNAYTARTGRPLKIKALRELTTGGVGGVARAIAYRNDKEVLKLHMPKEHTFTDVMRVGHMRYEVGGYFRLGGLDIRKPREVLYMDGI